MSRLLALSFAVAVFSAGCSCGNFAPVDDCNGAPCPDGGSAGGTSGTGGGSAAGGSAAGGSAAGGDAGGAAAGGDAGGAAAGGDAGGATAGGAAAGGVAGGSTAGGAAAGGSAAGGSAAGGAAAGGSAGGAVAGGSAGGGTASDGGVYDFCAEVAQRECDFYIRCVAAGTLFGDPVTGRANNTAPATQRTLCEATRRDECRIQQAGAERGRRAVNLTGLRTCLDAQFPSASCVRDRTAALTVCDINAFTTPLAAPGAICTSSDECAGGYCNIPGGNAACGQCVRFANPDGGTAACNTAAACAPGTFCRQAAGPDLCVPLGGADAGCNSTSECAPGYVCPASAGPIGARSCALGKLEGVKCV
ncbi:MAG: Dickkopf N-terminal cysteine-rich domain-containing protein [Myxococcales bacterium]|nr:Dickkopf N-terminal cysteine-rich domain-containing protein [Myxococcales bacterium]